jgi:hypothetical protein
MDHASLHGDARDNSNLGKIIAYDVSGRKNEAGSLAG